MFINYIRENALEQIKRNIANNIQRYTYDEAWLKDYFRALNWEDWKMQSRINVSEVKLIVDQSDRGKHDYENTKRVYSSLKNLSPTQASDERLWVYLTHVTFWDYMRARWDVESRLGGNTANFINERYFFMSNKHRALVRNGIARLWWFGYISYEEDKENPFELTEFLLSKQDIAHSLMERQYSNNKKLVLAILTVLKEYENEYPKLTTKKMIQGLAKYLQQIGGVSVLDLFQRSDIENIIKKWIQNQNLIKKEETKSASLL